MKTVFFALLATLSLGLSGAEVQSGDTVKEVGAVMGPPHGQVRIGDRLLLYYDRGEVELRSGVVSRVALLTQEDYAAQETKRIATAARLDEEQEARRARMSAEGEKLMARKLADPAFQAAPLAYQVAFWEDFSRRYPDVPSSEQLAIARLRFAEQLEAKRVKTEQAERLADLEARLREAEARVAQVEAGAYRGRGNAYYDGSARHPFNLWPVEYHYFDTLQSPTASPGIFNRPATDNYRNDTSSRSNYDNCPRGDRLGAGNFDFSKLGDFTGHGFPGSGGRFKL